MRRAAKIDGNQNEIVEALRQAGASVTLLHMVGNGCPDLLVGHMGCTGLIEVKALKTGKFTEQQIKWWDAWKGGPIAQVRDVEGALRFLQLLNPYIEQGGT